MNTCNVTELTLAGGVRAVRIENDVIATTILIDKGADIYELIYKPKGMDVLWKSPTGLKPTGRGVPTAFASEAAWLEHYAGGWQEIFPNGGPACFYKGVELSFHGEASVVPWEWEVVQQGDAGVKDAAEVRFTVRLFRSPFRMVRTMRVEAGQPMLILRERITNEAGEPMDYMWGHHPAYGAPFLSSHCHIDIGTRHLQADDEYIGTNNPLALDARYTWPMAGDAGEVDLSQLPDERQSRAMLGYFTDFEAGWYGITNTELGFGVGLVWPKAAFPYAWFWQELRGSPGFPWYKQAYVMAIEPFTSVPSQGLLAAMQKGGTHRTLQPGETVEVELRAVFYESTSGITGIGPDGAVSLKV